MSRASTFAAVLSGLLVAHQVADHWVQSDYQAQTRGQEDWVGRRACAAHVATYTATTTATVAGLDRVLGLGVSRRGLIAGQVISAVTHYWADRRFTLARLCERTGKDGFYRLGQPRPITAYTQDQTQRIMLHRTDRPAEGTGPWDNPTLGTGAYALDQSWHWAWLGVAALTTAVLSTPARGERRAGAR